MEISKDLKTLYSKKVQGLTVGAGDGNRTHVASLEGWSVTITQHPHSQRSVFYHNTFLNARGDLWYNAG